MNKKEVLLIDSPLVEVGNIGLPISEKIDFYLKLNEYCKSINCTLKIKLHPLSYQSDYLPIDENIIYLKDISKEELFDISYSCMGFFGFFSSMTTPLFLLKNGILFYVNKKNEFHNEIEALNLGKTLNVNSFSNKDLDFNNDNRTYENVEKYIKMYFYSTDGNSIKRLEKAIG